MTRLAAVVGGLMLIGSSAAVVAAGIEIESIVVSGPISGFLGIVWMLVFFLAGRRLLALTSLTLPLIALFVFALIFFNRWSPEQARRPVMVVLLIYEALAALLWLCGLWALSRGLPEQAVKWQFPLRSLMILMLIAGAAFGAGRLAMQQSAAVLLAVAIALLVANAGALAWLGLQAVALNLRRAPVATA